MSSIKQWQDSLKIPGRPDEYEGKQLLKQMGIGVPEGRLYSPDQIRSGISDSSGLTFPLVAKVCDPDILHKTDQGGVELRLTAENWQEKVAALGKRFPKSSILVEEMVPFEGSELIIGALMDPVFGPAVMFGAGGILTELYKDVTFRLAPLSTVEAKRMVQELVISRLFDGYRGINLDLDALAETVSAVGNLVVSLGDHFSQLDINPIVFDGKKWVALDAVVMLQ